MRRFLVVLLTAAAVVAAVAGKAQAGQCGIPGKRQPVWIDFADGSVPFWPVFARPGVIAAASNFIYPPQLRARGATTVYWEMHLNQRVGTPSVPFDPASIDNRADRIFDRAVASSACGTPWIALNELWGAKRPWDWSPQTAQYRSNVLRLLRRLAFRGARPFLLISQQPFTEGDSADWWRQVAQVADIAREVYFAAPKIHAEGVVRGSRTLRVAFRQGITDLTEIGIPPSRIGLFLGFQTTRGYAGREGLKPAVAWYEVVKLQALAARQVASEIPIATIWSWGWGAWSVAERDPDKEGAACVYLWTRNSRLCNGPEAAGPGFNASRTEGQLRLQEGIQCKTAWGPIRTAQVSSRAAITADREIALTSLFASRVLKGVVDVTPAQIRAAERAIVAYRFGGSRSAYRSALAGARASQGLAREVIADQLRQATVERRFRVEKPSELEIAEYQSTYSELPTRLVEARPAPSWLGRNLRGVAIESIAPAQVFRIPPGRRVKIRTREGTFRVRATGLPVPLGAVPLDSARPAIRAALARAERDQRFDTWLMTMESSALGSTTCRRDWMPALGTLELTGDLPFLSLAS